MSVTTTANPVSRAVLEALTDYDLHHSGDPSSAGRAEDPNPRQIDSDPPNNPEWWPTDHRGIPNHRPINRNLDRSQRPGGVNLMEMVFIFTMLRGVQLQAASISQCSSHLPANASSEFV